VHSYCTRLGAPLAHGDALASACAFALTLFKAIPNYLCRQEILSTIHTPLSERTTQLTFEVRIEDGKDTFSDLKVNGTSVKGEVSEYAPLSASNIFGNMLSNLFAPETGLQFEFEKVAQHHSDAALVFTFAAPRSDTHSLWGMRIGDDVIYPAYHGRLWIDAAQQRVLRLEMNASDFGGSHVVTSMSSDMHYAQVPLGDGTSFVLPTHLQYETCVASRRCIRNAVTYSQCHKFRAQSRILIHPAQ
jgi:hypothetical protein